jgi:hypothetical protein
MTRRRRRSFVLIETLTASALTVLTMLACISLFFFLWQASLRQQKDLEREGLRWRRISSLRWTLSRVKRPHKEDPFVLEGSDGKESRLVFIFDHGVHINPKLANNDLAQLYLDKQRGLVLVTRSHPKRACIGHEDEVAAVIWPGVKSLQWRFAVRPKDRESMVGAEQYIQDNWMTTWRSDWPGLPAIIQAIVEEEDNVTTVITAVVLQDIGPITLK